MAAVGRTLPRRAWPREQADAITATLSNVLDTGIVYQYHGPYILVKQEHQELVDRLTAAFVPGGMWKVYPKHAPRGAPVTNVLQIRDGQARDSISKLIQYDVNAPFTFLPGAELCQGTLLLQRCTIGGHQKLVDVSATAYVMPGSAGASVSREAALRAELDESTTPLVDNVGRWNASMEVNYSPTPLGHAQVMSAAMTVASSLISQ